jgi:hypothetical protein
MGARPLSSAHASGAGQRPWSVFRRLAPRYQIVVACFLATFVAYVERVGFSIAFTEIAKSAGAGEALKGAVLSAFYWGYGVSQVGGRPWRAPRRGVCVRLPIAEQSYRRGIHDAASRRPSAHMRIAVVVPGNGHVKTCTQVIGVGLESRTPRHASSLARFEVTPCCSRPWPWPPRFRAAGRRRSTAAASCW